MSAIVRRIPGIYLLIMSMLYAFPQFNILGLAAISISLLVLLFPHPVVSTAVGILTGIVSIYLTLAWISELSEFPSYFDAIPLFTGGFILLSTNFWAAYRMIGYKYKETDHKEVA